MLAFIFQLRVLYVRASRKVKASSIEQKKTRADARARVILSRSGEARGRRRGSPRAENMYEWDDDDDGDYDDDGNDGTMGWSSSVELFRGDDARWDDRYIGYRFVLFALS